MRTFWHHRPPKGKRPPEATQRNTEAGANNPKSELEPDIELEIKIFSIAQLDPEAGGITQNTKNMAIAAQDDTWDCDEDEATYRAYRVPGSPILFSVLELFLV
ncbi:unnamed protein product [Penicillium palitans]